MSNPRHATFTTACEIPFLFCEKGKISAQNKAGENGGIPYSAPTCLLHKSHLFVDQALPLIAMVTDHSQ